MTAPNAPEGTFFSSQSVLDHWQGHRRLTRRLIEAFPEDQLFTFSVGGMRPFGALATELLRMAGPTVEGVATGNWTDFNSIEPKTREELLRLWDESTAQMNTLWPQIPASRFHEMMKAFGQWEGRVNDLIMYVVDNEVHHRAQGYVYLRALNVEPPAFWERA
ncbi:MAG: damage-inducible protein DinB [Phycisphaerae bacterium]|nr:damage-inducible protein DinB [Gemmatimonadaceae bacterium]